MLEKGLHRTPKEKAFLTGRRVLSAFVDTVQTEALLDKNLAYWRTVTTIHTGVNAVKWPSVRIRPSVVSEELDWLGNSPRLME